MAALTANFVKESTATTGTGTINLGGAETGFIAFSDTFSTADTVHYLIEDGNNKEYGIGTLTTGAPWTLARTTVLETLVSGTFDDTSPTAISLSGSATVGVGPIAYPPGSMVGTASTTSGTRTTISTTIPLDDTIPQNTEGDEFITVTYTPKYADSILRVTAQIAYAREDAGHTLTMALFRDSTADADATNAVLSTGVHYIPNRIEYDYTSGSTASTTFKLRVGSSSGTAAINGTTSVSYFNGTLNSFIRVDEIRQ